LNVSIALRGNSNGFKKIKLKEKVMKAVRQIGSVAFVAGLFVTIFAGVPWHVVVEDDPVIPWWLRIAIFALLGGILVVLLTLALEQRKDKSLQEQPEPAEPRHKIMVLNSTQVPGREIKEVLGLAQGHTVFAIWLGKDLSALIRLILGGELTEYTEMMARARATATNRMIDEAAGMQADAIINVRYMTTSVVGSAAELFAYGTAVKLSQ
jgi:uncharacterized protein YbjQ (UPF0145 family)